MILLRHGQSEFNVHFSATRRDPGIADPKLTPLGHEQARRAAEALAIEPIRRVIASPYTRALQTAAPLVRRLGLPLTINSLVRERFAFTCDVGSPRTKLVLAWPEHDFSRLEEIWWSPVEEPLSSVAARAALFRSEMAALPDWRETVVVSHWGFILHLAGQSVENGTWLYCDPTAPAPVAPPWQS